MANVKFICSIWDNGKGYKGIRVLKRNNPPLKEYFPDAGKVIEIKVNDKSVKKSLQQSFWRKCKEIRHEEISIWIEKNSLKTKDRIILQVLEPRKSYRLK
ncbi:MAG: hypothetical protein ISS45_12145 [Candidatus Omnitrophica bacterium]|nr:hypothetical protein [Candidatus Omnitrophota bacterium]